MCQQWQFLVKSTAKTTNFSTKFELKVFKEPNYRLTFIKTLTVNFAFSSNILRLLFIFIHEENIFVKKNSTFVIEYTLYIIWTVSISTELRSF